MSRREKKAWALSSLHEKRYRVWGGQPNGVAPDPSRCCESVADEGRSPLFHQFHSPRGHGPEEAYCKVHDPVAVKVRQDKSAERYNARLERDYINSFTKLLEEALKKIAAGHNDARGLAVETLEKYEDSKWWKKPR